jgi:hypothetical protein
MYKFGHVENPKIYFEIPYKFKDKAKTLGCKWDKDKKFWFSYDDNSNIEEIKKNYNIRDLNKPIYDSLTVCNFCKHNKLSKDEIKEIQKNYYFLSVCNDCKTEYLIKQKYI